MSAKTRHTVEASRRLAVADLFMVCQRLIHDGKRSPQSVETLLRALQLFKENRLAGTVSTLGPQTSAKSADEINALLSLQLLDTGLDSSHCDFLRERGLVYVGEVFQFKWDSKSRVWHVIGELVNLLDLPPDCFPDTTGWQPPYTGDPWVRAEWNKPVGEALRGLLKRDTEWRNRTLLRLHNCGCHYAGSLFSRYCCPSRRLGDLRSLQSDLGKDSPLHAGMVVRDWTPPTESPAEWEAIREWFEQHRKSRVSRA